MSGPQPAPASSSGPIPRGFSSPALWVPARPPSAPARRNAWAGTSTIPTFWWKRAPAWPSPISSSAGVNRPSAIWKPRSFANPLPGLASSSLSVAARWSGRATRDFLAALPDSVLVFLDAPLDALIARCAAHADGPVRPVLADRARLAERWRQRLPRYRQAHLTIDTPETAPANDRRAHPSRYLDAAVLPRQPSGRCTAAAQESPHEPGPLLARAASSSSRLRSPSASTLPICCTRCWW